MPISTNADCIQKSFTQQAEKFETKAMNFTKQEYLDYTVSCIQPQKTDTILEVAAGTCACGRALAPFVRNVTCLDMTPAMLDVGKQQAKRQKIRNMAFVQGDAEALPFLDNRFDIVISRLAFHHFSNPYRCFSEMARVVKPSGKLVLIDMEAAEYALRDTEDQIEILRDPSHVRNLSKKELESLFTDHGFTLTACDCKKIPVSLSAWLALTNTPEKVSKMIAERMQQELKGGAQTGFYPYFLGNELYFHQRWILLIGKKQSQKPEVFPYPETL